MKSVFLFLAAVLLVFTSEVHAFNLDDVVKQAKEKIEKKDNGPDEKTKVSGLKEALSIGTDKAVKAVSQTDGYFGNQAIKIPVPSEIKAVTDALIRMGFSKQVEELILTMNRGAEKAAPQAASSFVRAIREMTVVDAGNIILGGDTAATEYFKAKTHDDIFNAFKPVISTSLNDVGATKAFKVLMEKANTVPFLEKATIDLDKYVTDKAIDGLFYMVGQEEKKIRTDPAARVTELLKTVFGKK